MLLSTCRPLPLSPAEATASTSESPAKKAKVSLSAPVANQQDSEVATCSAGQSFEPSVSHIHDADDWPQTVAQNDSGMFNTSSHAEASLPDAIQDSRGVDAAVCPDSTSMAHVGGTTAPHLNVELALSGASAPQDSCIFKALPDSQIRPSGQLHSRPRKQKAARGQPGIRAFFSAEPK